jgi:aconitate hydratase
MIGAGLLAKKAVEKGLRVPAHVKTSLAPGSKVVSRYLELSGTMPYLEALGFHLVGFGCTTCIGNSGPLHQEIRRIIRENNLEAVSVLSGNRNFEGRIHPDVKASYLASPILVVAYAIAGTMKRNLTEEPLGHDPNGQPVFLKDVWPSRQEILDIIRQKLTPQLFQEEYGGVYSGNDTWNRIKLESGTLYRWDPKSTYVRRPTFLEGIKPELPRIAPIQNARVLAVLGDSVTTDHISPAGAISAGTPAAEYLNSLGIDEADFNTYGSRRGNHEVMIRGTFGNIRIRNRLVPATEGGYTLFLPEGKETTIFEAARLYANQEIPLIVIAGKDYGMGSSRDWAAKGTLLLGIKAVIAESFERIHRSNLVGMGVLPLQFVEGESFSSLGLTGEERFTIETVQEPQQQLTVAAEAGQSKRFSVTARIDSPVELDYYRNGGILPAVLRKMRKP